MYPKPNFLAEIQCSWSKMKLSQIILLSLICYSLQAQEGWFIGGRVTPQYSFIHNRNDRAAAQVPDGFQEVDGGVNWYNAKPVAPEVFIPNSFSTGIMGGYSFTDLFTLEGSLSYSFQQQFYAENRDQRISGKDEIEIKQNLIKFSISARLAILLSDFTFLDFLIGVQPTYMIAASETRVFQTKNIREESGFRGNEYFRRTIRQNNKEDFSSPMSESIFNAYNLEALGAVGIRFEAGNQSEVFFRLRADRSLFDIENKTTMVEGPSGQFDYYYIHTPYRGASNYGYCPDCSEERPASYNFTVGLSVGYIYYLD